ncbi:hypothetical protein BAUCODRAFT_352798 [Baudoinia panamericana UAMH 10762]|uniref:Uncharacterized protein n=1 Tax=Baudoinia panamericana (strain UAMH 10762) TaxID=717646 RepID=M2N6W1_BAUPA|nr:uncharacterized protein BAUCODRAFT_352798 [Baudoinia panamericana UAMH 10762]EMC99843.1 hypothetical protein BAUCODRAFT_352798 [Baudoinia panamericana UAMH 10762]
MTQSATERTPLINFSNEQDAAIQERITLRSAQPALQTHSDIYQPSFSKTFWISIGMVFATVLFLGFLWMVFITSVVFGIVMYFTPTA